MKMKLLFLNPALL